MENRRNNNNLSFWLMVSGLISLGFIFIFISQVVTNEFWKASFSNVASAIIVAGIFAAFNEKIMKGELIETILAKIQLKQQIHDTGIEEIFADISNIDYRAYIKSAKKNIDIIHVYGRTWTTSNLDEIEEKLLNSNCQIRVVLVDPESKFIPGLADFYGITPEKLKLKIEEVTDMWRKVKEKKELRKKRKTQGSIRVYYHKGQPASSLYRIDDRIINVQNKFCGTRSKKLTTLVCKKGGKAEYIYDNFTDEIEELIKSSREVDL